MDFDYSYAPVDLLKDISPRKSSVFNVPGDQTNIPVVIGDWRDTGFEAVLIDAEKNIYIPADNPMFSIEKVAVADASGSIENTYSGENALFSFFPSYIDSTGKAVSAIRSSTSLGDKRVLVYGRGLVYRGSVLQNPADILYWLCVEYMGFTRSALDIVGIEKARTMFFKDGIRLRYILSERISLKLFLDRLCGDCNSSLIKFKNKVGIKYFLGDL